MFIEGGSMITILNALLEEKEDPEQTYLKTVVQEFRAGELEAKLKEKHAELPENPEEWTIDHLYEPADWVRSISQTQWQCHWVFLLPGNPAGTAGMNGTLHVEHEVWDGRFHENPKSQSLDLSGSIPPRVGYPLPEKVS
jgi:hypothetical protein